MSPKPDRLDESDVVYRPSGVTREHTNAWAFARHHGLNDLDALLERSTSDVEWFWDALVDWLDLEFETPYDRVRDDARGPEFTDWYVGGTLNLAHNAIDRHVRDGRGDTVALRWEAEDGTVRDASYAALRRRSNQVANALTARGVGPGDRVGAFMPMLPEAAAVLYGTLKAGAILVPMFTGFGVEAVRTRLSQSGCSILFTADGFRRRGREVSLASTAGRAVAGTACVRDVVVIDHLGSSADLTVQTIAWSETVGDADTSFDPLAVPADHPSMLLYSSGTTGRSKGTVQTHAGQLVKTAKDVHFDFDHDPSDRFFWMTDLGWVMGPWTLVGNHVLGGTIFAFEGAPDYPEPDRCWRMVDEHDLTVFGTSPTAIRAFRRRGETWLEGHDLSSLRLLGSTGEPWDVDSWRWFYEVVGDGECPIINVSGGTEMGGHFLSPLPGQPLKPCTVGQPSLGVDVDIVDADGRNVHSDGRRGFLVVRSSCPSMTRSLWEGEERYCDEYWSTWKGLWDHGDWAQEDEDGFWFIHGRSDEVITVSGRTVGPAEVEDALVHHPAVTEAAAVGVPDDLTGAQIVAYVVVDGTVDHDPALEAALSERVAEEFGRPFRPAEVVVVDDLPKNQSGKILRARLRRRWNG
jgi:acetyl-CoA synthetase